MRLTVSYKTPQALLGEFTRSVGAGGVELESRKRLPVGTRFQFEMRAEGMAAPVEVLGEVVSVTQLGGGKYRLGIRYDQGGDRNGLDAVLQCIFDSHRYEKVRKHPRIPIRLHAQEDSPGSPSYVIRDISQGGVGVELEGSSLPRQVRVGSPFLLEVTLSIGKLALHGEVVWASSPPPERAKWLRPSFGVGFGKLRPDTQERLGKILALKGLPPPPWRAQVSFGMDAVSRMP
ncbi:MAG: PilZ domain-containing protein [Myxococcales bacterium]|nr:PilZ domain-containing protein [Myxococcales bacterium]